MRNVAASHSAPRGFLTRFLTRFFKNFLHKWANFSSWRTPFLPLSMIAFTCLAVLLIALHLIDMRDKAWKDSMQNIEMVTRLVIHQDATSHNIAQSNEQRQAALSHIMNSLPPALAGRFMVFMMDGSGNIQAFDTPHSIDQTQYLPILTAIKTHIQNNGDAGIVETHIPQKGVAYAHMLSKEAGNLNVINVMMHTEAFAHWQNNMRSIFGAAALFILAMLGLVSAYWAQKTDSNTAKLVYERLQKHMNMAFLQGQCGLWDWDIVHGRVYWSDSMYALLGRTRTGEFISFGDLRAMMHPDDNSLYEFATHMSENNPSHSTHDFFEHEFRLQHVHGHWIWIRARANIMRDEIRDSTSVASQNKMRLIGIATDITAHKTFAGRIQESDQRLRDAIEATCEAFVLWDCDRRLVLCNDRYQSMYQLRDQDVEVGTPWAHIMSASVLPVSEHHLHTEDDIASGGRTLEIALADGRWFKINERRTREGGYVSIGTDITALKQQRDRLTLSEHELQKTVSAMTHTQRQMEHQAQQLTELAEKYLEQKAYAESANHAKSRFLASMSHNLRTPLNAIIGFSDMMEHEIFGALGCRKYVEYCNDIKCSGQYLLSVIDDILDMSRIEAGRITLQRCPIIVDDLIKNCMQDIAPLLNDKAIKISIRKSETCEVNADAWALQKILVHILQNAVKFTPEYGEIKIRIRKTEHAVNFAIEDSGRGIPKEAIKRLGLPFEQGVEHSHHTQQGSGLGLAIARSLTEMHAGILRIKSTEGVGTVVLVHIPHEASAAQIIKNTHHIIDDVHLDEEQLSLPIALERKVHYPPLPTVGASAYGKSHDTQNHEDMIMQEFEATASKSQQIPQLDIRKPTSPVEASQVHAGRVRWSQVS